MIAASTETPPPSVWDEDEIPRPDVSNLITEDDTPADTFSEKQMRLLTESLHASWKPGFPFVAMANVGVYVALNRPAVVPGVLVTTHVQTLQDLLKKEHRSYFSWMYEGKTPDIIVEIVSNTKGGELDTKKRNYEHMGVPWYAVYDPMHYLSEEALRLFSLVEGRYQPQDASRRLGETRLSLTIWEGEYEGVVCPWLRWRDEHGQLVLTGKEGSEAESKHAAQQARRAEKLAAKLRELGVDPSTIA